MMIRMIILNSMMIRFGILYRFTAEPMAMLRFPHGYLPTRLLTNVVVQHVIVIMVLNMLMALLMTM